MPTGGSRGVTAPQKAQHCPGRRGQHGPGRRGQRVNVRAPPRHDHEHRGSHGASLRDPYGYITRDPAGGIERTCNCHFSSGLFPVTAVRYVPSVYPEIDRRSCVDRRILCMDSYHFFLARAHTRLLYSLIPPQKPQKKNPRPAEPPSAAGGASMRRAQLRTVGIQAPRQRGWPLGQMDECLEDASRII